MRNALALLFLVVCPVWAHAQPSITLELDFLLGPKLELGLNHNDNYWFAAYSKGGIGIADVDYYQIGWSTPVSIDKRHNFGVSAGVMSLETDEDLWLLRDLSGDFSVVSGTYSYYFSGSDKSGFKLQSELMVLDFDNIGVVFGVGYKFHF